MGGDHRADWRCSVVAFCSPRGGTSRTFPASCRVPLADRRSAACGWVSFFASSLLGVVFALVVDNHARAEPVASTELPGDATSARLHRCRCIRIS